MANLQINVVNEKERFPQINTKAIDVNIESGKYDGTRLAKKNCC